MLVKNKNSFTLYIAVLLGILLLLNLIGRNWYKRFDLTDNKMYSLSKSSEDVLDKIDDLLTMKVYFSDDLPGELSNTQRFLQDLLEEYEAQSDNIRFFFTNPESNEELEEEATKGLTRARNDKGHYIADDPNTPENEAWVDDSK